jgi:two-component system sensor histidine kinase VicK
LTVRDTGPGIPPDELEEVFLRFHRLTTMNGSSGLGLAIAKSMVELHHGRIWAESVEGHGAAFHVTLPVRRMDEQIVAEDTDRG